MKNAPLNAPRAGAAIASGTLLALALSGMAVTHCGGSNPNAEAPTDTMPSAEPPQPVEADAATTRSPSPSDTQVAAVEPSSQPAPAPKPDPLTDEQIAAIADAANSAEIAQAKLAQSKSKDPEVKRFAAMMISHHGEAKQKQAKLKIASKESSVSTALQVDADSTLNTLKGDSGKDFDKAYVAAQVTGHQKVLDTIESKLLPNVTNPELRSYLEEIKPRVEEHLKQAKQLQESLDSNSKSSSIGADAKHSG